MVITFEEDAPLIVGRRPDQGLSIAVTENPGGSVTLVADETIADVVFTHTTRTGSSNNCQLQITTVQEGKAFQTLTPSICTVDAAGNVVRIADGPGAVLVTNVAGSIKFERYFITSASTVTDSFKNYAAGSLGKHVYDAMLALIAGKTPGDSTLFNYSTFTGDYANPVVVRNASNFAAGVDLSGMSVFRSENQNNGFWPGCLLTKRHYVAANHVTGGGSNSYCWMSPAGVFEKATPLSSYRIPGTDIHVGYLNRDIPTHIKRFAVLPANYATYLPSGTTQWLPSLSKRMVIGNDANVSENTGRYDALRVLSVRVGIESGISWGSMHPYAGVPYVGLHPLPDFAPWEVTLHNGDSSGPSWLLINGDPVLLGHYADISGSPLLSAKITEIEAAMNSMALANGDATSYALLKANLSGFTAY